jgi:hypothetical protein
MPTIRGFTRFFKNQRLYILIILFWDKIASPLANCFYQKYINSLKGLIDFFILLENRAEYNHKYSVFQTNV